MGTRVDIGLFSFHFAVRILILGINYIKISKKINPVNQKFHEILKGVI